ncbi:unnamed protein product [Protopolystoma xenopodis]|uniref:Uncharacterized protein n=1 Tax=Protopolystoma xenopodis TaxID=117903 RepID=A0A448X4C6_9PLAT|nr:unnamed protein product [Protopolystoma xenopodis]
MFIPNQITSIRLEQAVNQAYCSSTAVIEAAGERISALGCLRSGQTGAGWGRQSELDVGRSDNAGLFSTAGGSHISPTLPQIASASGRPGVGASYNPFPATGPGGGTGGLSSDLDDDDPDTRVKSLSRWQRQIPVEQTHQQPRPMKGIPTGSTVGLDSPMAGTKTELELHRLMDGIVGTAIRIFPQVGYFKAKPSGCLVRQSQASFEAYKRLIFCPLGYK